ncbi:hypothetical protein Esti_004261 [Eimeria stiedai]
MASAVSYLDYPVYSVASDGTFVITSGGGGGKDYGIEDQLEAHIYSAEVGKLVTMDSVAAEGVVDSLNYNENASFDPPGMSPLLCWTILRLQRQELCAHSDARRIGAERSAAIWGGTHDKATGEWQQRLRGEREIVARFSPSGEYVVSGGEDRVIRVWRVLTEKEAPRDAGQQQQQQEQQKQQQQQPMKLSAELVAELRGHEGDVKDVSMSDDSQLIASCASDGRLCVWRWREGALLLSRKINNPKNPQGQLSVRCCRFLRTPPGTASTQKRLIAVASDVRGPSFLFGWAVTFGGAPPARSDKKHDDPPTAADAAAAAADEAVQLQELCSVCCDSTSPCCQLAVSDDQRKIAIGLANGSSKVFDRGLSLLAKHTAHELPATGLCFISKGRRLLSTSADYSVAVLDTEPRRSWSIASASCCCWLLVLLLFAVGAAVVMQHFLYTGHQQYLLRQQAFSTGHFEMTVGDILEERLRQQQQQQQEEPTPRRRGSGPHDEL